MTEPRARTAEEIRADFMDTCRTMADYWATVTIDEGDDSCKRRIEGALHSWLCIIDGVTTGIHGFDLVAMPHPGDKDYLRGEGEDWSEPGTVINGDVYLHDMLYEGTGGAVTLAEFLNARLGEDEAAAQAALDEGEPAEGDRTTRYPYPEQFARCMHDGRHAPARVLREAEAKRKILAAHPVANDDVEFFCVTCTTDEELYAKKLAPCVTLRALAAVYSDHPDYDPSWAVT